MHTMSGKTPSRITADLQGLGPVVVQLQKRGGRTQSQIVREGILLLAKAEGISLEVMA
jgi:hypothetical protein